MTKLNYNVFDKMIEGVQVLSENLEYLYVNESMVEQSKNRKEDLLGYTVMEKYPGFEKSKAYDFFIEVLKNQKPHSFINEFEFPDGSRAWYDLRVHPVEDGILVLTFDITEQKRLEKELQQLNEILEFKVTERNKELLEALAREKKLNAMKTDFVSMASHEFKTPLTAIMSSLSLIEKYYEINDFAKCEKHYQRIKTSAHNLTHILNGFLSLDQHQKGKTTSSEEVFNVKAFFIETLTQLDGIRKKKQNIQFTHTGDDLVSLDKRYLRNIVFNLVSNAIKYSNQDITIQSIIDHEKFSICIEDQGIGIPEEQQKELFNKFFRASNSNQIEGTGLGMNIVKHYLEIMNGKITFESKVNQGTKFTVIFPKNKSNCFQNAATA
ncbi:PAS domain-containing sensor histidine kinase [Ochrovirga pacifica]|uniref:PAS domain-containing sensor histidine kinase n=1 Tax=Ochrovirga pacifica TaxID=1042376 RepID=UPI000683688F|nr:PAS domain-containing sensor histidine kinase [Ochrovirga pacifica]